MDINNFARIGASLSTGLGPITGGASACLSSPEGSIKRELNASVAVGYTCLADALFVGLRADRNLSTFTAHAEYVADERTTVASKVDYCPATRESSTALVAVHQYSCSSTMKLRAGSDGVVAASVRQQLDGGCAVTGSLGIPLLPLSLQSMTVGLSVTIG